MHRSAVRESGAAAGVRHGLAQVPQARFISLRQRELMVEIDEVAVELLLVDGLARGALPQFRGPVGRDRDQRHAALLRLDDRRVIIGARRPARAD